VVRDNFTIIKGQEETAAPR